MRSALVVLFNQDFSKNVPKLDAIYSGRFSEIRYVVPAHWSRLHRWYVGPRLPQAGVRLLDGLVGALRRGLGRRSPFGLSPDAPVALQRRIFRVVGDQFFFYDFLAQVERRLSALDVEWVWVVGDDALLNPRLDQVSLPERLGMTSETDAVLCRPVISRDRWLGRIAGSVEGAERVLGRALGDEYPLSTSLQIDVEEGAEQNVRVAVACADFFGLRLDLLASVAERWRRCYREKIYVELAMPNVLLAVSRSPLAFDAFLWERNVGPGDWRELADRLVATDSVFAHPIKLSQAGDDAISTLRSASS